MIFPPWAFAVLVLVGATGLSPYLALPLAVVVCGLVAVALDRMFYQHLRKLPKIITTISSLGVALMLRSVVQIFMGVNTLSYDQSISRATVWHGLRFKPHEIVTIGVMLTTVVVLEVFLHRSKWGKPCGRCRTIPTFPRCQASTTGMSSHSPG